MLGNEGPAESKSVHDQVMNVVRASFRPEFLNRLDEILLFKRLEKEAMSAIANIQLVALRKLLEDRRITLGISDAAITWLADKGFDPVYGARPLKRVIQRFIQDPLATLLLEGAVLDGQNVLITVKDDELSIKAEVSKPDLKQVA